MSLSFINLECPKCGATLSVEEDRKQVFCSYCGAKILLNNDNEYVFRHVNEAEVKRAEYEQIIKLKELEIEEKRITEKREDKSRKIKGMVTFELSFFAASLFMFLLAKIGGPFDGIRPLAALFMVICLIGLLFLAALFFSEDNTEKKTVVHNIPVRQVNTTVVDRSINLGLINNKGVAVYRPTPKKKWVAFFLCLFFGCFGVHKFYEGKNIWGILYIFTFGFLCFGVFIDLIIILSRPREYYPK